MGETCNRCACEFPKADLTNGLCGMCAVMDDPFAWADGVAWHKPAHRAVMASVKLGAWMSAALDCPNTCEEMKADIREWFSAGEPMEALCQALSHSRLTADERIG